MTNPPTILALDTATAACSVALWRGEGVAERRFQAMNRGQSEALVPMVAEVMEAAGCGFGDLDLLAVTVGPGAFTGLRIGLATARGMALAAGVPCLGVTTFEAVARAVPTGEFTGLATLAVVLESKREDVYAQAFAPGGGPVGAPGAVMPGELAGLLPAGAAVLLAGDAAERVAGACGLDAIVTSAPGLPDAAVVAAIAAERWRAGFTPAAPAPLYLRPPDATPARNGGRRRPGP